MSKKHSVDLGTRNIHSRVTNKLYGRGLPDPSANNWEIAPALTAFGLTSEPWLYLIEPDGTVFYRVEGFFTTAEIERQLQALADG